jgi:hypothetical protein
MELWLCRVVNRFSESVNVTGASSENVGWNTGSDRYVGLLFSGLHSHRLVLYEVLENRTSFLFPHLSRTYCVVYFTALIHMQDACPLLGLDLDRLIYYSESLQ